MIKKYDAMMVNFPRIAIRGWFYAK